MLLEKKFLDSILENCFDAVVVFDKDFKILDYNKATEALVLPEEENILNQSLLTYFPFLFEHKDKLEALFEGKNFSLKNQAFRKDTSLDMNAVFSNLENKKHGIAILKSCDRQTIKEPSLTKKRLKDALKAFDFSNNRLKSIINSSPSHVVAIDPKFRFILYNNNFKKYFEHLTQKKINLGVNLLECLRDLPELHKRDKENWEKALLGKEYTIENKIEYKGKTQYIEEQYALVRNNEREVLGASKITRNITERKRAEDVLKANEQKFRKVFVEASVGFAIIDLETEKILQANPALYEMLGFNQNNLKNTSIARITHKADIEREKILIDQLLQGTIPSYKIDKRIYNKSQQQIWVSVAATILNETWDGFGYNHALAIIENITERKVAKKRLEESEANTRALIQAFPDMIFQLSKEGILLDFSVKHNDSLSGLVRGLLGQGIEALPLAEHIREEARKLIEKAYKTKTLQLIEVEIPIKESRKTFEARFVYSGKDKVLVIVRNVTLLKQEERQIKELLEQKERLNFSLEKRNKELAIKEEELLKANEKLISQYENLAETTRDLRNSRNKLKNALKELEERNFELEQFVHKTSHDLRSPLNSILGIVNLVKLEPDTNRFREYIQRIEGRVVRLDDFIQSMLNYSRNNRSQLTVERIDFHSVIADCLDDLKFNKNIDKIEKIWNIEEETHAFYSDSLRIKIILTNIISNAIKYQDFKKKNRYIKVGIKVTSEKVCFEFEDNGIGIEQKFHKDLFKMFFRATEESEGSGLGLYIVKQTVDKLKGEVRLQSKGSKEGLLVNIELPNLRKKKLL